MDAIAVKQICIDADRASRLEKLAAGKGVTENALIAQALDLLFRETTLNEELRADWNLLKQMEAELGPAPARPQFKINSDDIVSVVTTPVAEDQLRRMGEAL